MSKIITNTESGAYPNYVNTSSAQPSDYSPAPSSASPLDTVWVLVTPEMATKIVGEADITNPKEK